MAGEKGENCNGLEGRCEVIPGLQKVKMFVNGIVAETGEDYRRILVGFVPRTEPRGDVIEIIR